MLTIAPRITSGPRRKTAGDKPVRILRLQVPDQPVDSEWGTAELGLQNPGQPTDLPKPTDIVVYNGQPWHFAGGILHPHPRVHHDHPETVLRLSLTRHESAVWWSEEDFTITKIVLAPHHGDANQATAPTNQPHFPFSAPLAKGEEQDEQKRRIFVVRSTVPVPEADNRTFKITFTIHGEAIDPDMHCGD
jgi:hypothetical protein